MNPARPLTIFVIHPSHLLTDYRGHGDGLIAYGFIKQLAARGHRLHVAVEEADLRGPVPNNVTLHPIRTTAGAPALRKIQYMLGVRTLFNRLSRAERFDVAHQFNPVFSGLSLALIGAGVPIVLGTYIPDWPRKRRFEGPRRFAKAAIAAVQQTFASALLLTTPAALTRVPFARLRRAKIHYLHNGVDTKAFSPSENTGGDDLVVLFLAQVTKNKGIFTLLEAFDRLGAERRNVNLWIAGDGRDGAAMRSQVSRANLSERIRVLGAQDHGAVASLYRSSAVYCLPSFGEPYGMTALEAMSCGKPVVTTNVGGPRHLVPEQGGRHVRAGDAAALAAALSEVLDSPSLREEMGRYNRAYVERECSWSRVIERLESVYASVATVSSAAAKGSSRG